MTYLFLSENVTEVLGLVGTYLRCTGIFFIPLAVVNIYRNGIQGMGYGLLPMTAGIVELAARGVTSWIASGQRSYAGVCFAGPAAWVSAGALLIGMYFYIMKHDMRKLLEKYPDQETEQMEVHHKHVKKHVKKCRKQALDQLI